MLRQLYFLKYHIERSPAGHPMMNRAQGSRTEGGTRVWTLWWFGYNLKSPNNWLWGCSLVGRILAEHAPGCYIPSLTLCKTGHGGVHLWSQRWGGGERRIKSSRSSLVVEKPSWYDWDSSSQTEPPQMLKTLHFVSLDILDYFTSKQNALWFSY